MSGEETQSDAGIMEWIAFGSVVVFGLGMAYAIHITNQTVQQVEANHYNPDVVTDAESEQLDESSQTADDVDENNTNDTSNTRQ